MFDRRLTVGAVHKGAQHIVILVVERNPDAADVADVAFDLRMNAFDLSTD